MNKNRKPLVNKLNSKKRKGELLRQEDNDMEDILEATKEEIENQPDKERQLKPRVINPEKKKPIAV